ncbi:MAG TPA: hypothetical protein PLQ76_07905, partial [bacterium]|nr:hypothetical protein [bacterium]
SWKTVMDTVRLARRVQPSVVKSVALLQIFPGTHWYDYCKQRNYLDDAYWLTSNPVPFFTFEHSELALSFYGFFISFASHWFKSPLAGLRFFFAAVSRYSPRVARAVLRLLRTKVLRMKY